MTRRDQSSQSLTIGSRVMIAAFDDIPEHLFLVTEVHDDCVCGIALTGPLKEAYGEPDRDLILRILPD